MVKKLLVISTKTEKKLVLLVLVNSSDNGSHTEINIYRERGVNHSITMQHCIAFSAAVLNFLLLSPFLEGGDIIKRVAVSKSHKVHSVTSRFYTPDFGPTNPLSNVIQFLHLIPCPTKSTERQLGFHRTTVPVNGGVHWSYILFVGDGYGDVLELLWKIILDEMGPLVHLQIGQSP